MKKYLSLVLAALLIVGALAGCGMQGNTPAPDNSGTLIRTKSTLPAESSFTSEEHEKLLALRFDGYEEMTVTEFQNKVWELTDTKEYRNLLEKLSQNTALYEQKDSNELASFLFYTLEPLTAEKWQTRDFVGGMATDYPSASDNAMLEFVFSLAIQNADTLTVGEYNATRLGVENGLRNILQGKTEEQLQNNSFMQETIHAEIEKLNKQWNTDKLQISVDYSYMPLSELDAGKSEQENIQQEQESREYPNGTEEDYRSLLDLKTSDYQSRSVADFNMDLLEWANENYERMERINGDIGYQDFSVNLSSDELSFVALTVWLSGAENGKYVQSNYTGRKEEDPCHNQYFPPKASEEKEYDAWCDLFYQFSYHIADKKTLTVGERDRCIGGMINAVEKFWNDTTLDDLLSMTKDDVISHLNSLAAEYSTNDIVITISAEQVHFDHAEERHELP